MLRSEDHGRVRVLTLDRPEKLNAFCGDLYDALYDAFTAAADDPGVAVVVLTGSGRAFSAGQDLGEMLAPPTRPDGRPYGFTGLVEAVSGFPKPLVAAVNGLGVGLGMTILAHCDLVLIADTARLRAPFAALGVVPEAASSVLFPERMGWQEAAWWLFSAEWLDADDAVRAGLAWRKVPADRLMEEALAVAGRIASMPVASLVGTKQLLVAARMERVRAAREREDEMFRRLIGGPANREAIAAFFEKREPDFANLPPE